MCKTTTAQTVNLGSKVWWDFNDNGIQDSFDWAGSWVTVIIYLDNNEDGIADAGFTPINGTTDANGEFLFTNLTAGKYFVKVNAGWAHYKSTVYGGDPDNNIIGDNNGHTQNLSDFVIKTETITLLPGTEPDGTGATNTNTNKTIGVGMWKANGLGDLVWADNNGNGMQDAGEAGIPNVTVNLKNNSGSILATTTTDANGKYFFYDPMGYYGTNDYQIEVTTPFGFVPCSSNCGTDDEKDSDVINGIISGINVPQGSWNHSFDAGFKPISLLPLNLLSFTGTLKNDKIELNWVTTNEVNVSHIIIEKSTDGINYKDLAMFLSINSGAEKNYYQYADKINVKMDGVYYYRLRTVNNNGSSTFSEVKRIVINNPTVEILNIVTYPNPIVNEVNVTLPQTWINKKVEYKIFNASGAMVKQLAVANSSKTNSFSFSNLPAGIYIVSVFADGKTLTQRVVKH
jgi:hypothetical protein